MSLILGADAGLKVKSGCGMGEPDAASRRWSVVFTRGRMQPSSDIARLFEIMAALRDPQTGCPWDAEQDFASIAPYTIEEAFEVADAIERKDWLDLRDELGDLLLQVVFHSQMAAEQRLFTFDDVVLAITRKMIRRHPHVFGAVTAEDAQAAKRSWNDIKAEEKAERETERDGRGAAERATAGFLSGLPAALPALVRAQKLQEKAAEVGFDWSEAEPILSKLEEEIGELRAALRSQEAAAVKDEMGDVLFSLVNLCRHIGADAEGALRGTNEKFRRRFHAVEAELGRQGSSLQEASLEEMERLWQQAKSVCP